MASPVTEPSRTFEPSFRTHFPVPVALNVPADECVAGDEDLRSVGNGEMAAKFRVDGLVRDVEAGRAGRLDEPAVLQRVGGIDVEACGCARSIDRAASFVDDRDIQELAGPRNGVVDIGQRCEDGAATVNVVVGVVVERDLSAAVQRHSGGRIDRQRCALLQGDGSVIVDGALQGQCVAANGGQCRVVGHGFAVDRTVQDVRGVVDDPFSGSGRAERPADECVACDDDLRSVGNGEMAAKFRVDGLARDVEAGRAGRLDEAAVLQRVGTIDVEAGCCARGIDRAASLVDDRGIQELAGPRNGVVDIG